MIAKSQVSLLKVQNYPFAGRQAAQFEFSDSHADEAQCWVADGGGHASHLAVLAFDQLKAEPTRRHRAAAADAWNTGRNKRLRVQHPGAAGKRFAALDEHAALEPAQGLGSRNPFNLRPVLAFVCPPGQEQLRVQFRFVAQQEQAFRIGVEPADGIHILGKPEVGQRTIGRAIGRELREDGVRFVEGNEHFSGSTIGPPGVILKP